MKLNFNHRGVKLFFITFAVAGRAKALSKLVDEKSRPELTILGSPFLFHVRLTLKKTVEEHRAAIDEIIEKARRGMIPVSGFISPGEKEVLRRLKAEPLARFIKTLPNALPPKYDPSAEDSRELAARRLVILSGMAETAAISSLDIRRSQAAAHGFRQNCLLMNEIAAALCGRR